MQGARHENDSHLEGKPPKIGPGNQTQGPSGASVTSEHRHNMPKRHTPHTLPYMESRAHCNRLRGGFCTACTRRLKSPTLLCGEGTCLLWSIYALELRLQAEKLPNMASLYCTQRHLVPGWVACTLERTANAVCTQCRKPLLEWECDPQNWPSRILQGMNHSGLSASGSLGQRWHVVPVHPAWHQSQERTPQPGNTVCTISRPQRQRHGTKDSRRHC